MTREVCRTPDAQDADGFEWRISIAQVSAPGPFSRYSGYRRLIGLIAGRGMTLYAGTDEVIALEPYIVREFDGDVDVNGELPFGPVSDLNVIFRPESVSAALSFSDRALHSVAGANQVVVLINLQDADSLCMADGNPVVLAPRDAISVASGSCLAHPDGGIYAIAQIEKRL